MRPVPGTPPVKLFLNKDKTNLSILRPGDNFTGGANLDPIVCSMYWDVYVYYIIPPFMCMIPRGMEATLTSFVWWQTMVCITVGITILHTFIDNLVVGNMLCFHDLNISTSCLTRGMYYQ